MIVDSSAILAILKREPDANEFARHLDEADHLRISAANWLETAMVIDSDRSPIASRRFDELLNVARIQIEPVTERQVVIAREAFRDFGRISGHPARLNFGDCFAYALAKDLSEPLLFKGDDFRQTDVESALP